MRTELPVAFDTLVTRLASEGIESVFQNDELLQAEIKRILPEQEYDFLRPKEGDYVTEGGIQFQNHGCKLLLGQKTNDAYQVFYAKERQTKDEKRLVADIAKEEKRARAEELDQTTLKQCARCDTVGFFPSLDFEGIAPCCCLLL